MSGQDAILKLYLRGEEGCGDIGVGDTKGQKKSEGVGRTMGVDTEGRRRKQCRCRL